ncbi:hypothetical protein ACFLV0_05340 [Chloroflexota bacterium]
MTPYLDDQDLWGEIIGQLRMHTVNSTFWRHYDSLKNKADMLAADYTKSSRAISASFHHEWVDFKERVADLIISNWIPNEKIKSAQKWQIPYDNFNGEEAFAQFRKAIPDLDSRLKMMEYYLQDLWDDINSIDDVMIRNTHCDDC